MQERVNGHPRPPRGSTARWLGIGLPLILGLGLAGVFVWLLVGLRNSGPAPPPPAAPVAVKEPAPKASPNPSALEEIQSRPQAPPPGHGIERWALTHLPEGWDPVIAEKLALLFETTAVRNPTDPKVIEAMYEARQEIEKYLATLGPKAIPTLSAILGLEPDFSNRRFLIYALGNLGPRSEEATFALLDFYKSGRDVLDARSEMAHVIDAMGKLQNETAYQEINRQLDDATTPDFLKDKFIQALGKHPNAIQSQQQFVKFMDYEEDAQIRNHSAQALGGFKDSASLEPLMTRYGREEFLPVRQTILGTIGKIGDESALPFLEGEARTSPQEEIRLSASRAIWRIGTPQALKSLRSIRAEEPAEMIRNNIDKWFQEPRPLANGR